MTWSVKQYTAFELERTRPAMDLLSAVPETEVSRAIDLGCGPGNSTELLVAKYPKAAVTGMDSSPEMVAAARTRLPSSTFYVGAIETWEDPDPFELILANAVLHWVGDHSSLMPGLIQRLAPGGSLAVQMPDNLEEPAHVLMREVAAKSTWAARLKGAEGARAERRSAAWYYDLLRPHCSRVDVWRTVYYHELQGGPAAVVGWFKGSGLRPFLAALNATESAEFLARYTDAIAQAYPIREDGTVLLPFPRLFFVATK